VRIDRLEVAKGADADEDELRARGDPAARESGNERLLFVQIRVGREDDAVEGHGGERGPGAHRERKRRTRAVREIELRLVQVLPDDSDPDLSQDRIGRSEVEGDLVRPRLALLQRVPEQRQRIVGRLGERLGREIRPALDVTDVASDREAEKGAGVAQADFARLDPLQDHARSERRDGRTGRQVLDRRVRPRIDRLADADAEPAERVTETRASRSDRARAGGREASQVVEELRNLGGIDVAEVEAREVVAKRPRETVLVDPGRSAEQGRATERALGHLRRVSPERRGVVARGDEGAAHSHRLGSGRRRLGESGSGGEECAAKGAEEHGVGAERRFDSHSRLCRGFPPANRAGKESSSLRVRMTLEDGNTT
jgi:hypothetical protein